MIAYMTYVFDELIDSSIAKLVLAIVANRFIQPLSTSFAKPQPCERLHRASRVRIYTKCWQRASYSCRFSLKTFLRPSDYMSTDLPSPYARIEEYIAPAFDEFNILQLNQPLDHYSDWIISQQHATVLRIVQRATEIGTYENLNLHSSYH